MNSSKEYVFMKRPIMLEKGNYGHWKVKMRARIKGIGADAWAAVNSGWKPPTVKGKDGDIVEKPEEQWTDAEKTKATYNSKALSLIFDSVNENQFKRIQNCECAKEAWDKLAKAYEGTVSVKRSRLDMLASRFEHITMEESESIEEFSGKLSAIASEAQNLGKKYKDKKLVKKLLRCLPSRFESKRTAMGTSLDTDTIEFEEVVGMLQAYEMEITVQKNLPSTGVAFAVCEERPEIQDLKNELRSMGKEFMRALRRVEEGNDDERDRVRDVKKNEQQCYECQGYGHRKANCPSAKKREDRCCRCGGFGHTKSECVTRKSRRNMSFDVSESDTEDDDDLNDAKYCAFLATFEEEGESSASEADGEVEDESSECEFSESESDEESEVNAKSEFRKLYDNWLVLCEEKIVLVQEKLSLQTLNGRLNGELNSEIEKNKALTQELTETRKKIHMLNSGTKDLDKILSAGRVSNVNHGLGYQEGTSMGESNFRGFVKGNNTEPVPATFQKTQAIRNPHGCYYCGKNGHIKRHCYKFQARVRRLIDQQRYYPYFNDTSRVFVRKTDLYKKEVEAYTSMSSVKHQPRDQKSVRDYGKVNECKVKSVGCAKGGIERRNPKLKLAKDEAEGFGGIDWLRSIQKQDDMSLTRQQCELLLSTLWMSFLNELCQSSRGRMKEEQSSKISN